MVANFLRGREAGSYPLFFFFVFRMRMHGRQVPENNISLVFEYAEFDLAAIASFHRGDSKEHRFVV